MPEFVLDNLRDAIDDSLFDDMESVPAGAEVAVKETMLDSLEAQHGWSIDSIMDNLQETVPDLSDHEAETIARSETQALVSEARERSYRERLDMDDATFKWQGPSDDRTTEACEWIKNQIDDRVGVSMDQLKELIQQAPRHDSDLDAGMAREWSPHPQCRHQPIRVVN